MRKLLYLLLITFSITAFAQQKSSAELLQPAAFAQKMAVDKGPVIDVRTPKEYQSGHIEGAVNLHVYDSDFAKQLDSLNKNKTIYVYCKAGGRSAEAVTTMKNKGFAHIVELDGGIDAWTEAGKPVKK